MQVQERHVSLKVTVLTLRLILKVVSPLGHTTPVIRLQLKTGRKPSLLSTRLESNRGGCVGVWGAVRHEFRERDLTNFLKGSDKVGR